MAEYRVLYTHQKTKKHKTWQDGVLKFGPIGGKRGQLFGDSGASLGAVYTNPENVAIGDELESDRFIITIEEQIKELSPDSKSNVATSHLCEGHAPKQLGTIPSAKSRFQPPPRIMPIFPPGGVMRKPSNQSESRGLSSQSDFQIQTDQSHASVAENVASGPGKRRKFGLLLNLHRGSVSDSSRETTNESAAAMFSNDDVIVTKISNDGDQSHYGNDVWPSEGQSSNTHSGVKKRTLGQILGLIGSKSDRSRHLDDIVGCSFAVAIQRPSSLDDHSTSAPLLSKADTHSLRMRSHSHSQVPIPDSMSESHSGVSIPMPALKPSLHSISSAVTSVPMPSHVELLPPPETRKRMRMSKVNKEPIASSFELAGGVSSTTVKRHSPPPSSSEEYSLLTAETWASNETWPSNQSLLSGRSSRRLSHPMEQNRWCFDQRSQQSLIPNRPREFAIVMSETPAYGDATMCSDTAAGCFKINVPEPANESFRINLSNDIHDEFSITMATSDVEDMMMGLDEFEDFDQSDSPPSVGGRKVLKPITSLPEDYACCSNQKKGINQSDLAASTADQSAHSIETGHKPVSKLRPLVTSPAEFEVQSSQSDSSILQTDQSYASVSMSSTTMGFNPANQNTEFNENASYKPTNQMQADGIKMNSKNLDSGHYSSQESSIVQSQGNDHDLIWDSLGEGNISFEFDKIDQSNELVDQSELNFVPEKTDFLWSQDPMVNQSQYSIQTSQSDSRMQFGQSQSRLQFNQSDYKTPAVQSEFEAQSQFRACLNNTSMVDAPLQVASTRQRIGPKMLRKSKQAFNSSFVPPETMDGSHHTATTSSSVFKGKFKPPLQQHTVIGNLATCEVQQPPELHGPLRFPSEAEVVSLPTPLRHTVIPHTFTSSQQYRLLLGNAIREHINIILFDLSSKFHRARANVEIRGTAGTHSSAEGSHGNAPHCKHGPAHLRAVKKEGPNKGRLFYSCSTSGPSQCKFFKWADEVTKTQSGMQPGGSRGKFQLSTPQEIDTFFKSHRIHFYSNCHLVRKSFEFESRNKYVGRGSKRRQYADTPPAKKLLFISMSRREASSEYGKDDLWVISNDVTFAPKTSFIAKSAFYGPTSSNLLEISPVSGYSPSNWPSGVTVQCIHAGNASTELNCLLNLEDIKQTSIPILSHLLALETAPAQKTNRTTSRKGFVPPLSSSCHGDTIATNWDDVMGLVDELIARYHLNPDQSEALKQCADMFNPSSKQVPLTLIHGVFGAGKSYLLTVIVLFLVQLFDHQKRGAGGQSSSRTPQKLLITSTTNVAVDRILLGLLDHGFEDFVRVGSVKKIAKPVLPYSIHSSGTESQELKELQDMLRSDDNSAKEKTFIRRSIEKHKQGVNKKRLSSVDVVGVTCAASTFPLLEGMVFPILLLDECSQMTEPASLIPIARFGCEQLILVGDPRQLAPTIQGSQPAHQHGLEQTLFERLAAMGHPPIMLRTQYRCHPKLSAISNGLFYDNQLQDGITEEQRKTIMPHLPTLCFLNVSGVESCASDGSFYNMEEAKVVVELLEVLMDYDLPATSVGVITLYRAQMYQIRKLLSNSKNISELKAIQISTVDAFQGGEREVILLSSVRTRHVGFIDSDRRTNVALTRAKRHLLILGNQQMLSCNRTWGHVISHCEQSSNSIHSATQFIENLRQ